MLIWMIRTASEPAETPPDLAVHEARPAMVGWERVDNPPRHSGWPTRAWGSPARLRTGMSEPDRGRPRSAASARPGTKAVQYESSVRRHEAGIRNADS